MESVVGIDFGTSNCGTPAAFLPCCDGCIARSCAPRCGHACPAAVAVWDDERGVVDVVPIEGDEELLCPSLVSFSGSGADQVAVCGSGAAGFLSTHPLSVVADVKRFLGRRFSDPEVQALLRLAPQSIEADEHDNVCFRVTQRDGTVARFAAVEVAALLLAHLRAQASKCLRREITSAVVTVPGARLPRARVGRQTPAARSPRARTQRTSTRNSASPSVTRRRPRASPCWASRRSRRRPPWPTACTYPARRPSWWLTSGTCVAGQ